MKDPLRDNRIFPEEMHQQPTPPHKRSNSSWVWMVIAGVLLVLLAYFGYQTYLNQQETVPENPSFEEQQELFNATRDSQPTMSEQDREVRINNFLYGGMN